MKKLILILTLLVTYSLCFAQTWDEIKKSPTIYHSGEGQGTSFEEADFQAVISLLGHYYPVINTIKTDESYEEERQYIISKMNTFYNSLSLNSECLVLSNEPDEVHVARWIKQSDAGKIFEIRKTKILEYVQNAEAAEAKAKIDVALRDYYWAYALLETLPVNEIRYISNNGEEQYLVSWIPEKINELIDSINIFVVSRNSEYLELYITYKDQPVTSLDYTCFNGRRWSKIYSAKDGKGVLELSPDDSGNTFQLKIEYAFKHEAHIDPEVYSVMNILKSPIFPNCNFALKAKRNTKKEMTEQTDELAPYPLSNVDDETYIRTSMDRLIAAIHSKQYHDVKELFTSDGFEMYNRLITYANAKIIGKPAYTIYQNGQNAVVRSIPMSFSIHKNLKKSFVDDVVFVFNPDGKIASLALGLDDIVTKGIIQKDLWPDYAKATIIEFLESYKTAFVSKDLNYIRAIFDENAILPLGKPFKKVFVPTNNQHYTFNDRMHSAKYQYLINLEILLMR